MVNLLIAALLVVSVVVWLAIASRRDRRRDPAQPAGDGWLKGRHSAVRVGVLIAAAAAFTVVTFIAGTGLFGTGEPSGAWAVLGAVLGLGAAVVGLAGLGWLATWTSRRRMHSLGEGTEPVVLRGRRLQIARIVWLGIFAALTVVFVANLGGLWAEASRVRLTAVPYDEFLGEGWYSLSGPEYRLMAGSYLGDGHDLATLQTPTWYPWLVVLRQAAVYAGVMGLAWFVFSRRPRHWMAFFVSIFIPVLALASIGTGGTARLEEIWLPIGYAAGLLELMAIFAVGAFLWVFPDGRFRGTYARWVAVLALIGFPLAALSSGPDNESLNILASSEAWENAAWLFLVLMFAVIGTGGIATQVFRYRRASPVERREARWTLAMFVLLAVWLTGGTALNSVFDGATWPAFVWRQAHVTLYVATPLLVGFFVLWLVRRQGWWDLDLFVNRGVVLTVVAPMLGALYLGVVLGIGSAFSGWTGQNGTVLAVVAATIVVAIAYRPTSRRVQAAIDRRFFAARMRAVGVVEGFDAELRSAVSQDEVRSRLLATVEQAFEPGVTTLWMRTNPDARWEARR